MVGVAMGDGDFLDIRGFNALAEEFHIDQVIISRVDNGEIISPDQIDITGKIISYGKEGGIEEGIAESGDFSNGLPGGLLPRAPEARTVHFHQDQQISYCYHYSCDLSV